MQEEADDPRAAEQAFTINSNTVSETAAVGTSVWDFIRMILVLALVAVAIYGIVYFLKKKTQEQANRTDPFLKVLANSHLGNNRYAHIVSVGKKAWLLGSSDGGVSLIGEIDDKEIIDAMLLDDSEKTAENASGKRLDFMALLKKLGVPAEKRSLNTDELRRHRERLKQM